MTSLLFGDMFNWKLKTIWDYIGFSAVLFSSLFILWLYFRWRTRRRNKQNASKKTASRLMRYLPKGSVVLTNATFDQKGSHFSYDNLAVGEFGIVAVCNIPRGVSAYGEPRSEVWKLVGHQQEETIPNPILAIEQTFPVLQSYLASRDIYNVPLDTLVVFCDDLDVPRFYLGRTTNVIVPKQIREFCNFKKAGGSPGFDTQALIQAVNEGFSQPPFPPEPKPGKKKKKGKKADSAAGQP